MILRQKTHNKCVNRKLAAVPGSCGASPAPVWPFPVTTGVKIRLAERHQI